MSFTVRALGSLVCSRKQRDIVAVTVLSLVPICAQGVDYRSDTYAEGIVADGTTSTLSGQITINMDSPGGGRMAVEARREGTVLGDVEKLLINLSEPYKKGIVAQTGGVVEIKGPVTVTNDTGHTQNVGISSGHVLTADGLPAKITMKGPVDVQLKGENVLCVESQPGPLVFDDVLSLKNSGTGSSGLYLFSFEDEPSEITLNGVTDIQTEGENASGMTVSHGTIFTNNSLKVEASDDAYALQIVTIDPSMTGIFTTDLGTDTGYPNPRKIQLNGRIRLLGNNNVMNLDLAAGSRINSLLDISSGSVSWRFYDADTHWVTVPRSTIGSKGSLSVTFIAGGTWHVPLSADNRISPDSSANAPLVIASGGMFDVVGKGTVLGHVQITLQPEEQQKFLLVQKSYTDGNGLNLALEDLLPTTDKAGYVMELEQENKEGTSYLYATLTHEPDVPDVGEPGVSGDRPWPWSLLPSPLPLPLRSDVQIWQDVAFTLQLPVHRVSQILASALMTSVPGQSSQGSSWLGQPVGGVPDALSIWMLPLHSHIRGKNLHSETERVGFEADVTGLGVQLAWEMTTLGRWGVGLFGGNGDMDSREIKAPIRSHSDYMGGWIRWAVPVQSFVVNTGLIYLSSASDVFQYVGNNRLQAKIKTDVVGGQGEIAWPHSWGQWQVIPSLGLEYWYTHQPSKTIRADGTRFYKRNSASQGYGELPVSVALRGSDLLGKQGKKQLQPLFDVRVIPSFGSRKLTSRIMLQQDDVALKISSPEMDRTSFELGAGLRYSGRQFSSQLRVGAWFSSHVHSQQISADLVYWF